MKITLCPISFWSRRIPRLIGLFVLVAACGRLSLGQTAVPRPVGVFTEEMLGRKPLNNYGALEGSIQAIRAFRPLDLSADQNTASPASSSMRSPLPAGWRTMLVRVFIATEMPSANVIVRCSPASVR